MKIYFEFIPQPEMSVLYYKFRWWQILYFLDIVILKVCIAGALTQQWYVGHGDDNSVNTFCTHMLQIKQEMQLLI